MRLALFILMLSAAGCQQASDNYLLFGSSVVSADGAVSDVNAAVRAARVRGCEPISAGGGTGLSSIPVGASKEGLAVGTTQIPREYDVYVIVSCPEGTPELLPDSGVAAP